MEAPDRAGLTPPTTLGESFKFVGPGLILTAGIVGTGELVITPRVASEHGFTLLWLIVLGCLVKVLVQVELGRYAVATGKTTLSMMDELPGPRLLAGWMVWLTVPVFVALASVIGGMLGGTAEILVMAGVDLEPKILAALLGLSLAALLAAGRYRPVERLSLLLVLLLTLSTVVGVVALQFTDMRITSGDIESGFRFHVPSNFGTVFAALGLIGVGASELIYYPYWCLEKGYGAWIGPHGDGWVDRAKGWLRVMRIDAFSALVIYTFATLAFYLLGAAILHGQSLEVSDAEMVNSLAQMYLNALGPFGLWVFIVGAFATLYSTAFAATAANARLLSNAAEIVGISAGGGAERHRRRVQIFSIGLPIYGVLVYAVWPQPVTLMLISGFGQAALLPFLAGMALYLRYRRLDDRLRPGPVWTAFLWLSAACMASIFVWQVISRLAT